MGLTGASTALQYTERTAPTPPGPKPREGRIVDADLTAALTPRGADRAAAGASARVVVIIAAFAAISLDATGLTLARVHKEATCLTSLRLSAVVTTETLRL